MYGVPFLVRLLERLDVLLYEPFFFSSPKDTRAHIVGVEKKTCREPVRAVLLRLEQQDRAVSEVEVDEVLGLCSLSAVLRLSVAQSKVYRVLPWVTKLPKFRPTMQCQVAPLRSSN